MSGIGIAGAALAWLFGEISEGLESSDIEAAKGEARAIDSRARNDRLRVENANNKLNEAEQRRRDSELRWKKAESRKSRAERKTERDYTMQQNQFKNAFSLLNTNEAFRNNYLNVTRRAA